MMITVLIFFIGLCVGMFLVLLYVSYLTSINSMFVIFPTGQTLGDLEQLKRHIKIEKYLEELEKE